MSDFTRSRLKSLLSKAKAVAITTDGWSDMLIRKYIGVTVHWIADGRLCSQALDMIPVEDGHETAENVWILVEAAVQKAIPAKAFISCVVTDGVTTMISARSLIADDGITCVDHSLHLVVMYLFGDDSNLQIKHDVLELRAIVKTIRASGIIRKALAVACKVAGLTTRSIPLDVCTRWNSTFFMIKQFEALLPCVRSAWNALEQDPLVTNLPSLPSDRACSRLFLFCKILKPFADINHWMQGETYVTISAVPELLHHLMTHPSLEKDSDDPAWLNEIRTVLLEQLHRRFDECLRPGSFHLKAAALHPVHCKMKFLTQYENVCVRFFSHFFDANFC